jgi:hypothetical protein
MNGDRNQETTEIRQTDEQVDDTGTTRKTVQTTRATDGQLIIHRIVWYIAGVIIALLVLRIVLLLLAANQGSPFVDFVYALSGIFAWPFYGIFNYTPAYGSFVFEISSVVAIAVYALIAWGIAKLATLTSNRSDV